MIQRRSLKSLTQKTEWRKDKWVPIDKFQTTLILKIDWRYSGPSIHCLNLFSQNFCIASQTKRGQLSSTSISSLEESFNEWATNLPWTCFSARKASMTEKMCWFLLPWRHLLFQLELIRFSSVHFPPFSHFWPIGMSCQSCPSSWLKKRLSEVYFLISPLQFWLNKSVVHIYFSNGNVLTKTFFLDWRR